MACGDVCPVDPGPGDLIRLAKDGDRQAQGELLAKHRAQLERSATRAMDGDLAARLRPSDVVQSAMLEALTCMPQFVGSTEREFAGWLQRILEHTILDRRKYHRRSCRHRQREQAIDSVTSLFVSAKASPCSQVASVEELTVLSAAMSSLPSEQREVILRCLIRGQSHREVAAVLGRSEGACRVLLARSRAALALAIERVRSRS